MEDLRADVLVIGGGPSGLLAAREAASKGAEVLVLEEHKEIGVPNHCTGILSVEGLQRLGVKPHEELVQHEIFGGRAYSPDGTEIELRSSRARAYAVDRTAFDKELRQQAHDAGAEILTGKRIQRLLVANQGVYGATGRDLEIRSRVIIDAEGISATLARSTGLVPNRRVLYGANVEVAATLEPGMVEVWLNRETAPGFFAWVVPLNDGLVRCGLASSEKDARSQLQRFLKKRLSLRAAANVRTGLVYVDGPVPKTCLDGFAVVGDAAGQTKPTTGGGVVLGGLCAMRAGTVAGEAVKIGDYSQSFLRQYENWWKKQLGSEFASMRRARKLLDRISDEKLNQLFASFNNAGLKEIAMQYIERGDMDLQRSLITEAARDPRLLSTATRVLGRLVLSSLAGR